MASALPARLKTADVQRFVMRAAQLQKFRPIVSYWCEYFILQQILSKNLHSQDEECSNYAVMIMDKLEAFKQDNLTNDAVTDDVAAKAYIENFALETFNRADEAQRKNSVTKQTADTFQAAATFLDLLSIWGEVEPETSAKSKFAKYHALRIAKAIKAGEDPNASNPVVEPEPEPTLTEEEGLEAELKALEQQAPSFPQQPTVEDAPEEIRGLPASPSITDVNSMRPPPLPSAGSLDGDPHIAIAPNSSSMNPPDDDRSRAGSIGGGYFPNVPLASESSDHGPELQVPFTPADFYNAHSTAPTPGFSVPSPLPPPSVPAIAAPAHYQPPVTPAAAIIPPPPVAPSVHPVPAAGFRTDDESVLEAQKHAKWAISALNFEDVNTAVKELRIALQSLGAS